ncbi:hypothetical protein [Streptomyces sp. NPDC050287]|uniref:hypothetical protein n=1 Tax=Streptomyces sp. NPDC050287 TaxID=3365608 RepID=UPI0037891EBF
MQQENIWDAAAAQRYDTPGTGMFAPEILGPAVDRLAELAGDGAALEFAIGTGRVAVPFAGRGVPVTVVEFQVVSHHFRFDATDQAQVFRSPHRYIWPAELDLMAQLAGFRLESRHADWSGAEFTAESRSHVFVYRIP